jgi:hypothetical protein
MFQYPIASLEIVELEAAVGRGARFSRTTTTARAEPRSPRASATGATSSPSERQVRRHRQRPSNPWLTGVSNLSTREYLLAKTRLAEHGNLLPVAQLYGCRP